VSSDQTLAVPSVETDNRRLGCFSN